MDTIISSDNSFDVLVKVNHPNYKVLHRGSVYSCNTPVTFPRSAEVTERLHVGDHVQIIETGPQTGCITAVLPRRNTASRALPLSKTGGRYQPQVLAVNLDLVVAVFAVTRPVPHWALLDRYLVMAEKAEIPVLICLTKTDLDDDGAELIEVLDNYRHIGYPSVLTSTVSGQGLNELTARLEGKISLLLGKSGVGKSSLINALIPESGRRTNMVGREGGKGKHTTTAAEMLWMDEKSAVIDSPGLREFRLWDLGTNDLAVYFPEMRPYLGQCRFSSDCRHIEEPGCAIRQAVVNQLISPYRYQSYLKIMDDDFE